MWNVAPTAQPGFQVYFAPLQGYLPTLIPSLQLSLHLLFSQVLVLAVSCVWANTLWFISAHHYILSSKVFLFLQAQLRSYHVQEAFSESTNWIESFPLPGCFSALYLSNDLSHSLPYFRFICICVFCGNMECKNLIISIALHSTQHSTLPICSVDAQLIFV